MVSISSLLILIGFSEVKVTIFSVKLEFGFKSIQKTQFDEFLSDFVLVFFQWKSLEEAKMGLPKQNQEPVNRRTKKSQKVATLEEQNKVLQQVLEASKNATEGKAPLTTENKELEQEPGAKAAGSKEDGGHSRAEKEGQKRKSESQNEGRPAKKDKKQDKEKTPPQPGIVQREEG